jgi:hypothetical protein
VQAARTARTSVFRSPPAQSDYVRLWDAGEAPAEMAAAKMVPARLGQLPPHVCERVGLPVLLWLRWGGMPRLMRLLDPVAGPRNRRDRSLSNRRPFTPID